MKSRKDGQPDEAGASGEPHLREAATTDGLPVAPGMGAALRVARVPHQATLVNSRVLLLCVLAVVIALASAFIACGLTLLIDGVTNLAFYGRLSFAPASPAHHHLGVGVLLVPVVGGLIVGIMARFGSAAIRGHGIPEAMEQVLLNQSRIAPRLLFLKPLSSAIAIGTGGPFGAEGPIIATGGALGSFIGQVLRTTAVELLLFEFRPRSIIPVALASVTATAMRAALVGWAPAFAMPRVAPPNGEALAFYIALGAVMGVLAVSVTRLVYAIEDLFEKLPVHWMWWPALGGLAVGVVGFFAPRTLGVGYNNITDVLNGSIAGRAALFLCVLKLASWSVSLGSGTSGGTLAPLFTIGGSLGSVIGGAMSTLAPQAGIDLRVAALVGMASLFAGASRALLASVIFAFETTLQPMGLLPLLGGCAAAYLVSCMLMQNTIMTEKIARRGVRVPTEYSADFLEQIMVREVALRPVVTLSASQNLNTARRWLAEDSSASHHQGYPVVDVHNRLIGVVTRRDLLDESVPASSRVEAIIKRAPAIVFDDSTLREAADHMVREHVGRLPVVSRLQSERVIGIVTRSDILASHARRLDEAHHKQRSIQRFASTPYTSTARLRVGEP
jgi:CIC family chloride channel protein